MLYVCLVLEQLFSVTNYDLDASLLLLTTIPLYATALPLLMCRRCNLQCTDQVRFIARAVSQHTHTGSLYKLTTAPNSTAASFRLIQLAHSTHFYPVEVSNLSAGSRSIFVCLLPGSSIMGEGVRCFLIERRARTLPLPLPHATLLHPQRSSSWVVFRSSLCPGTPPLSQPLDDAESCRL
jgi:hypothetical protein